MSLPREPRQKMINMMYLVLTALLALNVSAEILNAFKTVNKSLEITNGTVDYSTSTIMKSLEDKLSDAKNREKALIWYPKAQEAQKLAKEAYSFIQDIKNDIIKQGGGDIYSNKFKADNLDIATRLMVDKKKGKELKAKLEEFRAKLLKVDPLIEKEFSKTLPINTETPQTQSKSNNSFERAYFHMVPTVAALTVLSKFQNDIKTSENKVIDYCHAQVGAIVVRFNHYVGFAATDKSYVMPGEEMKISAGIGAFSDQALPTITIDGTAEPLTGEGVAQRAVKASSGFGKHTVQVNIKYTDLDGTQRDIVKTIEYMVGQSTASIALDKMNVLYIGVDNPVSVAASGAGADKIGFSITGGGGSYKDMGNGKYNVRVSSVTDECWINVSVEGKAAGRSPFRVRTVPEAAAYVGGQPSGTQVSRGAFIAQPGVQAGIKNFPFQLQYDVVSFTFTCDSDDDIISVPVQGAMFAPIKRQIDQNVKAGRMVTLENIKVRNPDGRITSAPSIFYYIN
jgi:gliding motility-associated protein GldM